MDMVDTNCRWKCGDAAAVIAAVQKHNAVIEDIANRFDNVLYVDQVRLLPNSGTTFCDICHLTPQGGRAFVGNLIPVIEREFPVRGSSF